MAAKQPSKIALISQSDTGLNQIRQLFKNPNQYMLREFLSIEEINQSLSQFKFEILMMRVPYFTPTHVQMLAKVRQRFSSVGLITSSPEIDPSARFQSRQIPNHKLILEPSEVADLPKVIEKMRAGDPSALRLHPRTRRGDDVELIDAAGARTKGRFVDFAQMGARLVVNSRQLLQKNTRIQVHYRSTSEPGRIHRIESVVVWQGVSGGMMESLVNGPQQTIGVRFIASL